MATANPFDKKSQSVSELAVRISSEPDLAEEIKKNPAQALAAIAAPLQSDKWVYRIVVLALGIAVCSAVGGAIVLAAMGREAPEILVALGSAAVGALAGLLAPSPANRN